MIKIDKINLPLEIPVKNISPFELYESELTCISGVSGSGKSTLLYLIGLLDDTVDCEYFFDGQRVNLTSERTKANFRKSDWLCFSGLQSFKPFNDL